MPQTSMRMPKDLRDALDELAGQRGWKRSDEMRAALETYACTRLENYAGREISYESQNLEEARLALGRVLSSWKRHPVAADQHELTGKLYALRDLVWTAFLLADAVRIDDRTAPGPAPADQLSAALEGMRTQLHAVYHAIERLESAADGRAPLSDQ